MEYSAQRVRAKARAAVKRREDVIETEEMESGELNLIPYLDVVTNLMLFLLFSISAGIVLTQIDTTLPTQKKSQGDKPPDVPPDEQPLKLFVSITRDNMVLWSVSGLEGTLKEPKPGNTFPRVGKPGDKCEGPQNCEQNECKIETSGQLGKCVAVANVEPTNVYDYRKLNDSLFEIAKRRYGNGKPRKADTYSIMLQADPAIPYSTIVAVMAAMRCKFPTEGLEPTLCALPSVDPNLKKSPNPISADGKVYDTERAVYDPTKMALFHEIGFSSGFE